MFQVDRSRKLLYTLRGAGSADAWTVVASDLPSGAQRQVLSIPKRGASTVMGFELARDGSYLYIADNLLQITRIRTGDLTQDLQFTVPRDAPPPLGVSMQFTIHPVQNQPEALVVSTVAGRLVLYDRDQPRPYTTDDFPSRNIDRMDPVLVGDSYVYAVQRNPAVAPCLVRYPFDELGFGTPDDVCDFGSNWGKYQEMKRYAGALVLESPAGAFGLRDRPESFDMRLPSSFDPSNDLAAMPWVMSFDSSTRTATYRIVLSSLSTGEPIGHYPPASVISSLQTPVVFLDDGTMVYLSQDPLRSSATGFVVIVPQWASAIERYP
jgi:hypothetical protein